MLILSDALPSPIVQMRKHSKPDENMKALRSLYFAFLLVALLCVPSALMAQLFSADYYYEQRAYQDAIRKYTKIVDSDPNNAEAHFNLANSYRLNGEFKKAEMWYAKAVTMVDNPLVDLYYAQMLLINGKYVQASDWFNTYANAVTGTNDERNARLLAAYATDLAVNGIRRQRIKIRKSDFNSEELDFSPTFLGTDKVVFASNRKASKRGNSLRDDWTHRGFVDLFTVEVKEGTFSTSEPVPFDKKINTRYHEGSAVFNSGGDEIYFTRNDFNKEVRGYDKDRNTRLKIYHSVRTGENWSEPQPLPFNSNLFNTAHPALSPDGRYLVFASDRPGGYGHMDLYISYLQDGKWSEPENLGPEINTAGNEAFPWLDTSGNLYFASNLHVGIGGLDMFRAEPTGTDRWKAPANLGAPLNSAKDDFGIIFRPDERSGYFTSNRESIYDNIYEFVTDDMVELAGRVIWCAEGSGVPQVEVLASTSTGLNARQTTDAQGNFTLLVPIAELEKAVMLNLNATKNGIGPCPGGCSGVQMPLNKDIKALLDEVSRNGRVTIELPVCPEDPCGLVAKGQVMNPECDKPVEDALVTLINRCTGVRTSQRTDQEGNYLFHLQEGCNYVLISEKPGFVRTAEVFTTVGTPCGEQLTPALAMVTDDTDYAELVPGLASLTPGRIPGRTPDGLPSDADVLNTRPFEIKEGSIIELYNVYFDLDKYNIRTDAEETLGELLALLNRFPEMKVELMAHTDSRASDQYNNVLSDNRAKSVMQYLIAKGISANRLTYRGYGESRLKNNCADGIACNELDHQRNRRVEFRVTYFKGTVSSKEYGRFRSGGN